MDPIAHTFTGAVLARTGLGRATPLAAAALIIGANAPDIDVVANFGGDYASLAWRRGWTHGVLALALLPFIVTGGLLLWDGWRRRSRPGRPRPRAGPLLMLAALGVLTHPTLDWLNNYGLRWLMPFDGRWFYGDALFIIDPWVWLALGGVLFLAHSRSAATTGAWLAFWLLASWLILTTPLVPAIARVIWAAGLTALLAARFLPATARRSASVGAARVDAGAPGASVRAAAAAPHLEAAARAALGVVAAYMTVTALANVPARAEVRAALERAGVGPIGEIMIGPAAADPFAGSVVAATPDAYHTGTWHWLDRPRFVPAAEPIPRTPADDPIVAAASATRAAQRYLTWSRFPYFDVTPEDGGWVVRIGDARYGGDFARLTGPVIRLDEDLEPIEIR
ncbi:MAG: metal-dependent hydrolase [Gammaproteobacteria bacterium]|nr:metal-dependent hydrolase [Gammaproteobacteria bacterium]